MLEFYSDNSESGKDIALKIFELGLKKCIQEPAYVLRYLEFLGHLNDDNSKCSVQLAITNTAWRMSDFSHDYRYAVFVRESAVSHASGDITPDMGPICGV